MASTMMLIKYEYLSGKIDFETAKKQLFEYASHPDAETSNNEVLRMWKYLRTRDDEKNNPSKV
jgi:hypothetical protein